MSLTTGTGPLGRSPAGRFVPPLPAGVVYVEPFPRRVRAELGGRVVLDTEAALLVHRPGSPPQYAFPDASVDRAALEPAGIEPVAEAPGHVHVGWDAVDAWYEEEEQVFGHPRNPYHRVDCVRTRRRLRVEIEGSVLVDTDRTVGLYETALAPRLYVPRDLVRMDLLVASTTTSYCPYKGTASYWSFPTAAGVVADVAWSYEDPLPESSPIAAMLCFYDEHIVAA